jgi:hypothetical protein
MIAPDKFCTVTNCQRCRKPLAGSRTMSWFTDEAICMSCSGSESVVKKALRAKGVATASEGCGYIPYAEAGVTKEQADLEARVMEANTSKALP